MPQHVCELTRKGLQWARTGHPWVYRDDLASAQGAHGDVVLVACQGKVLGTAFLSVRSKISLRWIERSAEPAEPDPAFWRARIERAHARRQALALRTNAYRVVHDAADGIPGLVVDRYGPVAVVQTTIAGTERLLPFLGEELGGLVGAGAVIARNDLLVREKEGLEREVRVLSGAEPGPAAEAGRGKPWRVWVHEDGPGGRVLFHVDPRSGQKTGAYLDQRENRWRAAELARGRFLDAFSHGGLFALHAAKRCSEAVAIDSSEAALELCEEAAARNGIGNLRCERANVFDRLKEACEKGERFDTVVLDPPAFAKSRAEVPAAARGYRELNRRAMEILSPGGVLVTCSCSYNLGEPQFLDVLRTAAADARSSFTVLERRGQASDHPVLLSHPESAYLKCVVLRKE
ncbi:MAG: class I SAM-dependent rRNA methyltransferase [Planctomycetes bacterium]|nr:class I SAM-dependent rRNA methyltransferase [Planctomycetota bacterium]